MAKTRFIDISDQTKGLIILQDSTKAPFGSARRMDNCLISDRKGITKRPGISSLGDFSSSSVGNKSFFVYTKSFGSTEIALKNYGTAVEYLHNDLDIWTQLEAGFTTGQEFGYKEHLVNTENEDYMYFCNRTEDYRRWAGSITQTNGALAGGETTVTVDTVLKPDVIYSGTATASSATTLDVAGTPWASSQWISFYVYITSGVHSGKIRLITSNDNNTITFDTLGSDPGSATFQIRMPAFAASGTLVIGTEEVAYSAIPSATTFTTSAIVSAHADNSPVTVKPTAYPANPRGNRLEVHYTRMVVGNVRSAMKRDSSGTLGGSQSTGSYYVSKLKNATDFTFTATRVATEGDIVSVPYGGGDITDIVDQEDKFYIFKKDYIEAANYTQDANDIIQREQLKPGFGSIGKTVRGKDDVYFITAANEITSLGRVEAKDSTPQSINIGYPIKRLLDTMDFANTPGGAEHKDRLFFIGKESEDDNNYTRMIVFNRQTNSFEGVWQLSAAGMDIFNGDLCFAESNTPNVFKMFQGVNDVRGSNIFGISMTYTSNWMNLTSSNFHSQALEAIALEGYIRAGTTVTINLYKDFETTPFQTIEFSGDEDEFLSADNFSVFLGANPLGVEPMGSIADADSEGLRHFTWQFYFPPQYGTHFSYEYTNSGRDQFFDISRIGLGLSEDVDYDQNTIKTS
jgi:hypothetical protein